ncbi:hypothetical protein BH23BAC2_BH23BAC2_08550 [soil metagenome]
MIFGIWGLLFPGILTAQEITIPMQDVNEDDLGNVSDAFQENFFEALKQRAIENYEKAVAALRQCEKIQPDNPVVHFELGKNYRSLKDYEASVQSLQRTNRIKPNQEWVLVELMEVYQLNNDFESAILIAKNLIPYNSKYSNNLAEIYLRSKKYDELLSLLDALDARLGINEFRLDLRQQIYGLTENAPAQIQVLKDAIKANPENETNYLNLVFIYSAEGMEKEAFKAAEDMRKAFPTSTIVHLALYKFYLNDNNTRGALDSMKIVFIAEEIDTESKFKVLNDFLNFVLANPEFEDELQEVTALFAEMENSPGIYQKLGEYFLLKDQKEQALTYFEKGLSKNLDNLDLLQKTILLQLSVSKFREAGELSNNALEIFPGQPLLYLVRGVALNNLKEFKEADQILTFGLDYVIENKKMEVDFYEQLSIANLGLGNAGKAKEFQDKANDINKTLN